MSDKLKTGLILTGGGARVAYQVGVLKALQEILPSQTIPFEIISGTSAGGINAAYLSARAENWQAGAEGLYKMWKDIHIDDVYKTSPRSLTAIAFAWIIRTLMGGGNKTREIANFLLDTKPLGRLLVREIDFEAIRGNIKNRSLHALSISALEYFNDRTVSFFEAAEEVVPWERAGRVGQRTSMDVEHILASAAIPVFFPPVPIQNQFYGDGCVRQMTPLSPAIHMGADRLLCIGIRHERSPLDPKHAVAKAPSIAQMTGELFNSLFLDPLHADAERLKRINDSVARFNALGVPSSGVGLKQIPILSLMPSQNLSDILPNLVKGFPPYLRFLLHGLGASDRDGQGQTLISYLAFFKDCIHPLLDLGYKDTIARREEVIEFMKPG